MPVGAIIGGVAAIGGALISSSGSKKAAKTQAQAADNQTALQREIYNKNAANFQSDISAGNRAATRIDQLLGLQSGMSPQQTTELLRGQPGYQYRMNQALDAVNAGAAARGMFRSGAALKALEDRAYNVADQGFNTYLAQVTDVANRGSAAKSSLAGVGQNYANASAAIAQSSADAQSNAALANAANWNSALGGLANVLGQAFPSSYSSSNPTSGWGTPGLY